MLGRQIQIFMAPEDQLTLENAIHAAAAFTILEALSESPTPERKNSTILTDYGEERLRIILVQPGRAPEIRYKAIPGTREFTCDVVKNPIIEYDRCYYDGKIIRSGRLYFVPRFYNANRECEDKGRDFTDWCGRIFKAVRSSAQSIGKGYFAGAEAIKMRNQGRVRFEGLS